MNGPDSATGALSIGTLARRAGVNVETVRYYQRRGLMRTPPKPRGGIRRYGEDDLARLRFIRRAKALGFSLADIRALLQLNDDAADPAACRAVRAIAEEKLADVRQRIHDLSIMADQLKILIAECASGRSRCAIIQSLTEELPSGSD
jgi:MerR family mercuric resistance operon transcriptional regulator